MRNGSGQLDLLKIFNKSTKKDDTFKENKKKLKNILDLAETLCGCEYEKSGIEPVFSLVKFLCDEITYSRVINKENGGCGRNYHTDSYNMFANLSKKVSEYKDDNTILESFNNKYKDYKTTLRLGKISIITFPFQNTRIVDALMDIGVEENTWREYKNHKVKLIMPIGMALVTRGNHSIFSGIVKQVGTIDIGKDTRHPILDISNLYDTVKFDGTNFINIETGEFILDCGIIELGQLFEVGRLIMKYEINYLK